MYKIFGTLAPSCEVRTIADIALGGSPTIVKATEKTPNDTLERLLDAMIRDIDVRTENVVRDFIKAQRQRAEAEQFNAQSRPLLKR